MEGLRRFTFLMLAVCAGGRRGESCTACRADQVPKFGMLSWNMPHEAALEAHRCTLRGITLRGGSDEDLGLSIDARALRAYRADFEKYRRPSNTGAGPLDHLLGKQNTSGQPSPTDRRDEARPESPPDPAAREEERYEEWASDADVPDVGKIEPCEADGGVSFDMTAGNKQWLSAPLISASAEPGGQALKEGVIEVDGVSLDATLFDLASLAAQDLSGQSQRLTARKVGTLIKCVADADSGMPTQFELNVFQKMLRDFDMASDARKLLSTHIRKVETWNSNAISAPPAPPRHRLQTSPASPPSGGDPHSRRLEMEHSGGKRGRSAGRRASSLAADGPAETKRRDFSGAARSARSELEGVDGRSREERRTSIKGLERNVLLARGVEVERDGRKRRPKRVPQLPH